MIFEPVIIIIRGGIGLRFQKKFIDFFKKSCGI